MSRCINTGYHSCFVNLLTFFLITAHLSPFYSNTRSVCMYWNIILPLMPFISRFEAPKGWYVARCPYRNHRTNKQTAILLLHLPHLSGVVYFLYLGQMYNCRNFYICVVSSCSQFTEHDSSHDLNLRSIKSAKALPVGSRNPPKGDLLRYLFVVCQPRESNLSWILFNAEVPTTTPYAV